MPDSNELDVRIIQVDSLQGLLRTGVFKHSRRTGDPTIYIQGGWSIGILATTHDATPGTISYTLEEESRGCGIAAREN